MLGIIGKILIYAAFGTSVAAVAGYFFSARKDDDRLYRISNYLYGFKGLLMLAAFGILTYLIFTHQFQYFYVFNHTSRDLELKYLFSTTYGGQEGSFMLWILWSSLVGLGLIKWTREPYRKPVMFVMAFTQMFLLSMLLGFHWGEFHVGASPFRTLAEEMPNAPFLQSNPDFVPADGNGLNDLLKSPWMMIHPPILFLGFSMMTVPFAFAMASLWKQKYHDWLTPALPWTLASNLCLLTAIFLGGYWAYVTLSFGGYWAWDPVENASFVPWLFGTAGIHAMIIQRKSSTAQKTSILFMILAYLAIVYETFLTRSGILADSSVHSFVDLGLYNQLLVFMLAIAGLGLGLFFYRYKELPSKGTGARFLSREFMTFAGAMMLFIIGLVIILGTSSPILGQIFVDNPTPPAVSFYNNWSMPLAMLSAVLTVIGQFVFWKKYDAESLSSALIMPLLVTTVVTIATIILGNVRDIYYMLYVFCAYFALVGNAFVMIRLIMRNPKLIGGTLSHVGFAVLLLGILASNAYQSKMLDLKTRNYNKAVEKGQVKDKDGFPVRQKVEMLELKLNQPKLVNGKYLVTYEGYRLNDGPRPGQQTYRLKFEDPQGKWDPFYMNPVVYPMLAGSSRGNIQWTVDPDVRSGLASDIYLYVAGSAYVERKNKQVKEAQAKRQVQPASEKEAVSDTTGSNSESQAAPKTHTVTLTKGQTINMGGYTIQFEDFAKADPRDLPDSTVIGVRSRIIFTQKASGITEVAHPLFAVIRKNQESWTYSPPMALKNWDIKLRFAKVDPQTGKVDLEITGISEKPQEEWVLLMAEEKPFISIVWLGTFILMGGFSISIFRHWFRLRKQEKAQAV